jgi:hypothetical protein
MEVEEELTPEETEVVAEPEEILTVHVSSFVEYGTEYW